MISWKVENNLNQQTYFFACILGFERETICKTYVIGITTLRKKENRPITKAWYDSGLKVYLTISKKNTTNIMKKFFPSRVTKKPRTCMYEE